jgi:fructose-specific phosphotransferase system component IIB
MHIITLNCADDTEKKRVRYVIDKWEGEKGGLRAKGKGLKAKGEGGGAKGKGLRGEEGKVAEVKAIVVKADLAEGAEIEKIEPEKKIERLNVMFKEDIKSVEKLISFIFSKKNATLREHRHLSDNFSEMVYQVYMRRGKGGVEEIL